MNMELLIWHDGSNWVVKNERLTLSAPTLEELDVEVERFLRGSGMLREGETAEVFMTFDNSTIPQWIRQYAQHYFNRVLEVRG
ncbi:MAG TPA: hypothetical protein ENJ04_05700 [Nitrospirae bacterium]|nr:hypothetical protein [Nitrospirota bacterium]